VSGNRRGVPGVAGRCLLAGVVCAAALPTACTRATDPPDAPTASTRSAPAAHARSTPAPPGPRYTVTATVREDHPKPPAVCGPLPTTTDDCSTVALANWSWDGLPYQEDRDGRFGRYLLVGAWDGETLTLTAPPVPATRETPPADAPRDTYRSPCPAPPGGWKPVDPARATHTYQEAAVAEAEAHPTFGGVWLDDNSDGRDGPPYVVLNVTFTEGLAAREADLRRIWGGALCVSRAARSRASLERVRDELSASMGSGNPSGLYGVGRDDRRSAVNAYVFAETPAVEAMVRRYDGAVVVRPWLRLV
jgi:hypothetical protein